MITSFHLGATRKPSEHAPILAEAQERPGTVLVDSGPSIAGWHMLETFIKCPQLFAYRYIIPRLLARERVGTISAHPGIAAAERRVELDTGGGSNLAGVRVVAGHDPLVLPDDEEEGSTEPTPEAPVAGPETRPRGLEGLAGESRALTLGTMVHIGIAHWYCRRAIARQGHIDYMGTRYTKESSFYTPLQAQAIYAARAGALGQYLLGEGQAIQQAYEKQYVNLDAAFDVVAVEHPLRLEVYGYPFTARADLIVRDRASGQVFIWDHKTAGRPNRVPVDYSMSGQIHGLRWHGMTHFPGTFAGVTLNAVGTGKNIGIFWRGSPAPAPAMTDRFPEMLRDRWHQIRGLIESGRHPLRYPQAMAQHACRAGGRDCVGHSICAFGAPEELREQIDLALASFGGSR